jgi:RNA polymerase sigma-70 factor (ECF subfamily)
MGGIRIVPSQGVARRGENNVTAFRASHDEARLMRRVADGERGAFEELYRLYHPRLTRFLSNMLRKPELIEEVLNDALMVVWRSPASFKGASKLSTWIFTIAYRKALRARSRWDEPVDDTEAQNRPSDEPGPEQHLGQRQVQKVLLIAMAGLSADHRTVIDLTYFHEMGHREIAEIMGCPVDTVKTRVFHARRHLKNALAGALADWL